MRDELDRAGQQAQQRLDTAELHKLLPAQRVRVVVDDHISTLEDAVPALRSISNVRESLVQDLCKVLGL